MFNYNFLKFAKLRYLSGQGKDDVIFIMSMVTSFGAVVYFGLKFNERQTNALVKWLLAFPMFAASVAARAFTLAVFLKETLDNKSEWFGAIVLLGLYIGLNVLTFKLCRQVMFKINFFAENFKIPIFRLTGLGSEFSFRIFVHFDSRGVQQ